MRLGSGAVGLRRVRAQQLRWVPPLIAGALGLYQLSEPSLWLDEAITAENATDGYTALWDELHWLYYATLKPWVGAVGLSEFTLRLPSVAGAVLAVSLLYKLTARMLDAPTALIASALLAIHPLVVQWSQQARGYTILLCLAIGATWLLVRALERDTFGTWLAYGVALVLLFLWQVLSATFLLPAHVLVAWRSPRARLTWYAVLLSLVPWFAVVAARPADELPTIWIAELTPTYVASTMLELSGALGLGLVLAIIGLRYADTEARRLLAAWAFAPPTVAIAISQLDGVFLSRYLIVAVPGFTILAAIAIVSLSLISRATACVACVAAASIGLAVWYAPSGSTNVQGEDWRRATAFLMAHGGAARVDGAPDEAYSFYGGRLAPTCWVVERRPVRGFGPSRDIQIYFGERLRVTRRASCGVDQRRPS